MDYLYCVTSNILNCSKAVGYVADSALTLSKIAIPYVTGYDNNVQQTVVDQTINEETMNALNHIAKRSLTMTPGAKAFVKIAGISGSLSVALNIYGGYG